MKIKPLGFYVLVEMISVDEKSAGGIILPGDLVNKEQEATDVGYVREIGPTAYHGYPGCDSEDPHGNWGLEIGQKIEYRKFEGKRSAVKDCENFRYIPDSHIIGVISDD
jgi:co-chaperonin GroES (HSP10)